MRALGIGVDIIDNSRIKKSITNNFKDISIVNDKYGKPSIKLNDKLQNIIKKRFKTKKVNVYLSISDEKKHSIAFVILGKK